LRVESGNPASRSEVRIDVLAGTKHKLFSQLNSIGRQNDQGTLAIDPVKDATLVVRFAGQWRLDKDLPPAELMSRALDMIPALKRVSFDTGKLVDWDSGLLSFLMETDELCRARGIVTDHAGLPTGLRRLLELAEAVPEKKGTQAAPKTETFFVRVGDATLSAGTSTSEFLTFIGMLVFALGNFVRRKARYRTVDLIEVIQQCGASAVGIVTLISFLVGVILAFMGAVQLSQFGAAIYVADLVGIGMVREMGAMMTAIIMSGRTGAAFAAKLGTMKVTEEIDALTTMGISPFEFLVLPRVLALVVMMPLLCLYADFVGILGGMFVGVTMLGLSPGAYMRETISTLTMANLFGGLFKATFYGVVIALAGCFRGFHCGNSSSAVGDAATEAVVMSIVMVVIACGTFAVLFDVLGI
jgi:phospholipid/cholesterol/gamma-HCH transport system permease protein